MFAENTMQTNFHVRGKYRAKNSSCWQNSVSEQCKCKPFSMLAENSASDSSSQQKYSFENLLRQYIAQRKRFLNSRKQQKILSACLLSFNMSQIILFFFCVQSELYVFWCVLPQISLFATKDISYLVYTTYRNCVRFVHSFDNYFKLKLP